jgi:flagellar assembly protein FliH
MANECTIKLDRKIRTVSSLEGAAPDAAQKESDANASIRRQQEAEVQSIRLARKSLESGAEAVAHLHEKMVAGQAQHIANLAVEIARKILQARVAENDYRIEAVIEQALKLAPSRHNVIVRLHPDDLARLRTLQEQDGDVAVGTAEFVADATVGRAECIVETPKGSIESYLDEHLLKIEEAIKHCWQTN